MGAFSHFELQKALFSTLSGDATLLGLVTGVYERVPEGSAYPYAVIGGMEFSDRSTKTGTLLEAQGVVHVYSRAAGRKETATICDLIHTLLHQSSPSISGHVLTLLRITGGDITLDADGLTYHGILRFTAMTEPA